MLVRVEFYSSTIIDSKTRLEVYFKEAKTLSEGLAMVIKEVESQIRDVNTGGYLPDSPFRVTSV